MPHAAFHADRLAAKSRSPAKSLRAGLQEEPNSQGEKQMAVSKLVADFARFAAENQNGAKSVSDLLAEVDTQRDEDNWTPEQLDLVEDEIIDLPVSIQIAQLTE